MPKVNKKPPLQRKLIMAVTSNKIIETEALLNGGANPNQIVSSNGGRLLHFAVRYGYLKIVALLLQHSAKESINKQDKLGRTPLHEPVITRDIPKNAAIAALLLQYGASMFIADNVRQTPLKLAIDNKHVAVQRLFLEEIKVMLRTAVLKNDIATTEFLLAANTNPNQEDNTTGCTLLHFASRFGFLEIVTLLLQHGVDVHQDNKFGFTALHYAADNNHKAIVELLLQYGAFKFIKDKYDKTPGGLAASKGYLEVATLLHPNSQANKNISSFFSRVPKPTPLIVEIEPSYVFHVKRITS
jgi:serine/threonine-protein phosphatase 6 regulatory ankyrin repeat subunit B